MYLVTNENSCALGGGGTGERLLDYFWSYHLDPTSRLQSPMLIRTLNADNADVPKFSLIIKMNGWLLYCLISCCVLMTSTLVAGLLAKSRYPEGPATGHLGIGFSWFPCLYKQMLRWFPRFQVATACFLCSPPDLNFLDPCFIFMYKHYNHCHRATAHLQVNILLLLLLLLLLLYSSNNKLGPKRSRVLCVWVNYVIFECVCVLWNDRDSCFWQDLYDFAHC